MKQIIIISAVLLTFSVSAQEFEMGQDIMTCESGTEQAVHDFEKGLYAIYSFGLVIQTGDQKFGSFYKNFVYNTYGIRLIDKGCVVMPNDMCYSNKMTELLHDKYGNNLLEVAKAEARIEFDKRKQ